jgi:site-specific recombinase XerD
MRPTGASYTVRFADAKLEVEKLIEAARGGRNEARDRCLLLLMFRHGFRVSEAPGLPATIIADGSVTGLPTIWVITQ